MYSEIASNKRRSIIFIDVFFVIWLAIGAVVVAWPTQGHEWSREITWPKAILVHPLFCTSLLAMFSQSFNPFLYFQF